METFSALLAICAGNSPVPGEFPAQRPVTRSFDVFFDLRPNKLLSKHWWGWRFEAPSRPLWRHCNVYFISIAAVEEEHVHHAPSSTTLTSVVWFQNYPHEDLDARQDLAERGKYVTLEFEPCFDAADFTRAGRDIFAQRSHVSAGLS